MAREKREATPNERRAMAGVGLSVLGPGHSPADRKQRAVIMAHLEQTGAQAPVDPCVDPVTGIRTIEYWKTGQVQDDMSTINRMRKLDYDVVDHGDGRVSFSIQQSVYEQRERDRVEAARKMGQIDANNDKRDPNVHLSTLSTINDPLAAEYFLKEGMSGVGTGQHTEDPNIKYNSLSDE